MTEGTATETTGGTVIMQSNKGTEIQQRRKTSLLCSCFVALFLCVGPLTPSSSFPLPPSAPLAAQQPQYPQLPSETPARLTRPTDEFDYVKRDVMIMMR